MGLLVVVALVVAVFIAVKVASAKIRNKVSSWHEQARIRGYELDLYHRPPPAQHRFDHFVATTDTKVWTTVARPGSADSAVLYKFELRSGDVDQKFRRSCALIELPFRIPKTVLRPRSLQTIPNQPADGDDVLLGHDDFDAAFRLQTNDSASADAMLGPDVAAWLLTAEARFGSVEFEMRDDWMLCACPKAEEIDELIDLLEWAQNLRDRLSVSVEAAPQA